MTLSTVQETIATVQETIATTRTRFTTTREYNEYSLSYTYSWYRSVYYYWYLTYYPAYTPTTTTTTTTFTTLSAYVTDSAAALVSFAADTSSIQSYHSAQASLDGDFAEIISRASAALESITGAGTGGGSGVSAWRANAAGLGFVMFGVIAGAMAVFL